MSGTAAAAASAFTVTRTSSLPACWSARVCSTVARTSAVSVFVMDWTTIEVGHRGGGGLGVHRDAHQLTARLLERARLLDRRTDVGGIGVRHGLDDDRVGGAHPDPAHIDNDGVPALVHGVNIR